MKASYDQKRKRVITGECRLSFPNIWETGSDANGEDTGKYSVTLYIPKKDRETFNAVNEAIHDAITEKWGDKKPKKLKLSLKDGDELFEEKGREEYQGNWVINASSKTMPGVVDRTLKSILPNAERERLERLSVADEAAARALDGVSILKEKDVYAGCWIRCTMNVYAWNHKTGGEGVSFGLQNIQKTRDGTPFGGKRSATQDFEALEDGSENYSKEDEQEAYKRLMG